MRQKLSGWLIFGYVLNGVFFTALLGIAGWKALIVGMLLAIWNQFDGAMRSDWK